MGKDSKHRGVVGVGACMFTKGITQLNIIKTLGLAKNKNTDCYVWLLGHKYSAPLFMYRGKNKAQRGEAAFPKIAQ